MIIFGRLIDVSHATGPTLSSGWLAIEDGRIVDRGEGPPPQRPDFGDDGCLVSPGFIDAHVHLPQFDSIGCDGMELLEWLDRVIYPAEARWADQAEADRQAARAYRRMLRAGTLGYAGFLTSHITGYVAAVRAGHSIPLRALVGQVLMDHGAPDELLHQPLGRMAASARSRVRTTVNPRFALSCGDELLALAARRASKGAIVHTHLAESRGEVERARAIHPNDATQAILFDRHGLLSDRTLLAHGLHLTDDDWRLVARRGSVIVHCPGANTFLRSGLFDLDVARRHRVRVALGSDVAAGPDVAMPRVARAMIDTAKCRAISSSPEAHVPTPAEAWRLITRGNAEALGWTDAGTLEVGAAADLLVIRPPFPIDEDIFGRLIYDWDDAFIARRILNGRSIDGDDGGRG